MTGLNNKLCFKNASMTKILFISGILQLILQTGLSQERFEDYDKGGFRKENLFTGGGISLGFGNRTFQTGASPFLGYNLGDWVDLAISTNYHYVSYRDVFVSNQNDKIRRSTLGVGAFTRIYPINFIFLHAQIERNFITEKFIPGGGGATIKNKVQANSFLVGGGYASGRYPNSGQPFFYLSILFDLLNSDYSPYTDGSGRIIPIIRGGMQIPIFQGRKFSQNRY